MIGWGCGGLNEKNIKKNNETNKIWVSLRDGNIIKYGFQRNRKAFKQQAPNPNLVKVVEMQARVFVSWGGSKHGHGKTCETGEVVKTSWGLAKTEHWWLGY